MAARRSGGELNSLSVLLLMPQMMTRPIVESSKQVFQAWHDFSHERQHSSRSAGTLLRTPGFTSRYLPSDAPSPITPRFDLLSFASTNHLCKKVLGAPAKGLQLSDTGCYCCCCCLDICVVIFIPEINSVPKTETLTSAHGMVGVF